VLDKIVLAREPAFLERDQRELPAAGLENDLENIVEPAAAEAEVAEEDARTQESARAADELLWYLAAREPGTQGVHLFFTFHDVFL
jgi:hypothetical protein